jgi:hypothetical protein
VVSFWGREEESGQRIGLNQPTKHLIMRRSIGIYQTIIRKIYKIIGQKEGSKSSTFENGKILLDNITSLNRKDICLWGGQDKELEILCRLLRLDIFIMDRVLP